MHENVRVKSDNDLISVSLYKPQLAKKSYAVIGIIPPLVVERRGRKHTATVLADGT